LRRDVSSDGQNCNSDLGEAFNRGVQGSLRCSQPKKILRGIVPHLKAKRRHRLGFSMWREDLCGQANF
jgi:hypothetical protein